MYRTQVVYQAGIPVLYTIPGIPYPVPGIPSILYYVVPLIQQQYTHVPILRVRSVFAQPNYPDSGGDMRLGHLLGQKNGILGEI